MMSFSAPICAPAQSGFSPLFRLLSDFDSYNREAQGVQRQHRRSPRPSTFKPKFDVRETATTYELHGELPGIERDNVKIEFTDDQTIVVRGRVERTYNSEQTPEASTTPEPVTEKTSEGSNDATADNADNQSTDGWHHATVEDDPEDESTVSASVSRATPSETPKTEVAQPATAAPEVRKTPAQNRNYLLVERSVGEFSRAFSFPTRVDQEGVTANLENGVLTVSVPKAKKHEVRRIAIN